MLALESYVTKASVAATKLTLTFESVGPGIELLGLGPTPASGVQVDFHEVARSIGGGIQVANVITVDDQKGDSHIRYDLKSPPVRFGELLGHSPQKVELVKVDASRGTQTIEVTNWGMQYQPGSSGTLDGTIDMVVRGEFDYRVHFSYPHRKDPDVTLSCM